MGEIVAVGERDAVEGHVVLPVGEAAYGDVLRFAQAGSVRGDVDDRGRQAERVVVIAGGCHVALQRRGVDEGGGLSRGERRDGVRAAGRVGDVADADRGHGDGGRRERGRTGEDEAGQCGTEREAWRHGAM